MIRALLHVLAALAVASAAAAPAGAATVSAVSGVITIAALPAEANDVRVQDSPDGGVDVLDRAPMHAGTGCVPTSDYAVHCPGRLVSLELDLGDGDDRLVVGDLVRVPLVITGGVGDDIIAAGPGDDVVDGGPGDDRLAGAAGGDRLLGGPGADVLAGMTGMDDLAGGDGADVLDGGPRADQLSGGADADVVTYADRAAPVTVALGQAVPAGEAGEGDGIAADVEHARGGSGDDHLTGSDALNRLDGGGGADVLAGGAGPDILAGDDGEDLIYGDGRAAGEPLPAPDGEDAAPDGGDLLDGGDGRDRIKGGAGVDAHDAGAGDDVLDAREPDGAAGNAERVVCGEGADLARLDAGDTTDGCEYLARDAVPAALDAPLPPAPPDVAPARTGSGSRPPLGVPRARSGLVLLPVHCSQRTTCVVTATLTRAMRRIRPRRVALAPRVTIRVPAGERAVVTLRLNRRAVAALRRSGRLRGIASVTLRPGGTWARPVALDRKAIS